MLRLLRVLSRRPAACSYSRTCAGPTRETLALLEYLADNLAAERVLCVATVRDEGGDAAPGWRAGRARVPAVLPLGRLNPAAMARMVRACLDAPDLQDTSRPSSPSGRRGAFWPSGGLDATAGGHVPSAVHQPIDGLYAARMLRAAGDLRGVFSAVTSTATAS